MKIDWNFKQSLIMDILKVEYILNQYLDNLLEMVLKCFSSIIKCSVGVLLATKKRALV